MILLDSEKTLRIFLEGRYGKGIIALSKHQAILLGIPYPLIKGWFQRFKDLKITREQEQTLISMAGMRRKEARKLARSLTKKDRRIWSGSPSKVAYQKTFESSKEFLQTYEWRKVRMQALKLSLGRCCACGASALDGVRLHVDHIKPRALYPELALTIQNLQVLCEECNHGKGNWDMTDWRGVDADVLGLVEEIPKKGR